jgi:hypothetical protein
MLVLFHTLYIDFLIYLLFGPKDGRGMFSLNVSLSQNCTVLFCCFLDKQIHFVTEL